VDVGSLDAIFSCLGTRPSAFLMLGMTPERTGSRDLLTAPANVFAAADGYVYLHAGTNPLFPRLCEAMGRPELAADERYRDVPGRMAHIGDLEAEVGAWTHTRTIEELTQILERAGIPFGPVAGIPDVVASPQLQARDMVVEVDHPALGTLILPGIPVKLTPGSIRKAPPTVGEHNDHVYTQILGYSAAEYEALKADGAI
jgi:crotonobetainyl-CoA:carnitine CoA-transferase CaiB-like acyl-CoA transferase